MTRARYKPSPHTMTIEEAAEMLGIGRYLAYKLAREGRFPTRVLRIGKLYRVPRSDIERLLGIEGAVPQAEEATEEMPAWKRELLALVPEEAV